MTWDHIQNLSVKPALYKQEKNKQSEWIKYLQAGRYGDASPMPSAEDVVSYHVQI